jgi:hypothetical protein
MSGLEIAGVLLGTFPLIISGIEHWRTCARVGGYYWKVRKEYSRCRSDVQYHEILYKRNLKELLVPIVDDVADVDLLVANAGGQRWKDQVLQDKLVSRLHESYKVYVEIIEDMNETAEDLRKELCFDEPDIQGKLVLPETKKSRQPSPSRPSKTLISRSTMDYHVFRAKFSLGGKKREELFAQLKECNDRLEKLLSSSDKLSALQNASPSTTRQMSVLESTFKKACKKSESLFRALQRAWNCSCQQYHFANLRLEHRRSMDICFEIILMFVCPSDHQIPPWSWKELQCDGNSKGCDIPHPNILTVPQQAISNTKSLPQTPRMKKVGFHIPTPVIPRIEVEVAVEPAIRLCELLRSSDYSNCVGIIGHDEEEYHLHPFSKRKEPENESLLTLDFILSQDFEGSLSRRERYSIALLLASSVAQLQFTPWLRTGLTKECILFFSDLDHNNIAFGEPFIRQGFATEQTSATNFDVGECNFFSLGILLLELCFGKRLQDHPLRRKHADTGNADAKQAFDLMAAIQWSRGVCDEGGEDYDAAVKWCFTGAGDVSKNWRAEMIKNVIRPLEMCQEHFKTAAMA